MTEIPLLKDKNIVVGVTGGIAAYKAAGLTSRLVQAGGLVDVIMTEAAAKFVGPITFQALTQRPVVTEMFELLGETEIGHVTLGKRADLMVIAPATANTLAKLAHGFADNMLTTTSLACRGPILLAISGSCKTGAFILSDRQKAAWHRPTPAPGAWPNRTISSKPAAGHWPAKVHWPASISW
jgi:hypothetical protein